LVVPTGTLANRAMDGVADICALAGAAPLVSRMLHVKKTAALKPRNL
jgi:hypothetical protein